MKRTALACLCFALAALSAAGAEVAFKLADPKGAPISDAVVSLMPLDAPPHFTPPADAVQIAQSGQEFMTFVTPVVVGTTVSFPNEDNVGHQVYSLSPAKKFALSLHKPGSVPYVIVDRPGVVALGCNIHDWMLAYIVVLETPWFAKSANDGAAVVAHIPPGRYRAEVWHARLAKTETRELTIADDATSPVQAFVLTLKPDRRIRRPVGSAGGGYK